MNNTQALRKTTVVRMRNYGRIIQDMVQLAVNENDAEKREALIIYIAQCMRQKNALWNRELESGVERLKDDIQQLSNGALVCDFPAFDEAIEKLAQRAMPAPERANTGKKKKK